MQTPAPSRRLALPLPPALWRTSLALPLALRRGR